MADPAHIADHVRGAKRPCGTPFTAPYSRELLFCIALCSMQCANYGYPTPTFAYTSPRGRRGWWQMETTRANFSAEMLWTRADLFFLSDALARGMSIQELAGFLNRSEDEVRQQAGLRRHESISSSDGSARERHRRSTENKSTFSAGLPVSRAKRRTSAARFKHSDLSCGFSFTLASFEQHPKASAALTPYPWLIPGDP